MSWIAAYVAAAAVLLGLESAWLGMIAKPLYQREIGGLLLDRPNLAAAGAFYAIYLGGVVVFAVRPALEAGSWSRAAVLGALLGLVAYATYDLTNLATLKGYSARVVIADLAWGTFATTIAALAGYAAGARIS